MNDALMSFSTKETPQNHPARTDQVENNAGGYTFTITDRERLRRFLILGAQGGTYYVGQEDLAREAGGLIVHMAETDFEHLVSEIVEVSTSGRAPKPNPALFALAVAASHGQGKCQQLALSALPEVARTGTHLFTFIKYAQNFRGWGRGMRRAVGGWYLDKDADALAYQALKYRSREGFTHRDALRLSHPKPEFQPGHAALFDWVTKGEGGLHLPELVHGFEAAQQDDADLLHLIRSYDLSWEMLPTEALNDSEVWKELAGQGRLPLTALIRQLPRLTRIGALDDQKFRKAVVKSLTSKEYIARSRIHPMNVLVAQRTYVGGESVRGSSTWTPNRHIVDALDETFRLALGNVEESGKRTMLALDVSGSMGFNDIAGLPITPREASAAMAVIQMGTEQDVTTFAFTASGYGWRRGSDLAPLSISPRQRIDDAVRAVSNLPFGGTDCALPMIHAKEHELKIDTFVVYTDNETWHGQVHPFQALKEYRKASGIHDAKLIVVAMTPTRFSIADPDDPGMLDVVGFDTATPNLINAFSRGDI